MLRVSIVLLAFATFAFATDVTPPLPATIPLIDAQPLKGQITRFDDQTVTVLTGETTTDVRWTDVKPQAKPLPQTTRSGQASLKSRPLGNAYPPETSSGESFET